MNKIDRDKIAIALYNWLYEYEDTDILSIFDSLSGKYTGMVYRGAILKVEDVYVGNEIKLNGRVTSWTSDDFVALRFCNKHADDLRDGAYSQEFYDSEFNPLDCVRVIITKQGLCECLDMTKLANEYADELAEYECENDLVGVAEDESEYLSRTSSTRRLKIEKIEIIEDSDESRIGLVSVYVR